MGRAEARPFLGSTGGSPVVCGGSPQTGAQAKCGAISVRRTYESYRVFRPTLPKQLSVAHRFVFARAFGEPPNATGEPPVLPGIDLRAQLVRRVSR